MKTTAAKASIVRKTMPTQKHSLCNDNEISLELNIATVLPWYYRVPQYFFTVLNVVQNQWYHATLPSSKRQFIAAVLTWC